MQQQLQQHRSLLVGVTALAAGLYEHAMHWCGIGKGSCSGTSPPHAALCPLPPNA
jgi:hypothetical protein